MKRSLIILLFISSISSLANAQDLTGTWVGRGAGVNYFRIVLIKCSGQYIGYTYDSGPGFCHVNFAGDYKEDSKRLRGEGRGIIRKSFEHSQSSFNLKYKLEEGIEYLEGTVGSKSSVAQILSLGITLPIRFKKISTIVDTTDYMRACISSDEKKKQGAIIDRSSPVVLPPPLAEKKDSSIVISPGDQEGDSINVVQPSLSFPDLTTVKEARTNDTVATVFTKESVIHISVYDNGQIDGDTITVFHNDKVIAERLGVTASPYKFTIAIDHNNPHHEIVLVANNLGSIPPNTAVVIIEAGDKRYNLFASSDLNKNSVVIFRFQE